MAAFKKYDKGHTYIPSSFQATNLITDAGLKLGSLETSPSIDVGIDGADEVDSKLNLIKGGGGCHLLEKIVAVNCKKFVVIADHRKKSSKLGEKWKKGIPVSVVPFACKSVERALGGLDGRELATAKGPRYLKMAKNKAGPVVTDNGGLILDIPIASPLDPKSVAALDTKIR